MHSVWVCFHLYDCSGVEAVGTSGQMSSHSFTCDLGTTGNGNIAVVGWQWVVAFSEMVSWPSVVGTLKAVLAICLVGARRDLIYLKTGRHLSPFPTLKCFVHLE